MSEVEIPTSGGHLIGTLHLPQTSAEPVPGVILLHGFTSDRDESPIFGCGDTLFARTSRALVAAGFPVLRFDFRGHGASRFVPFEEIDLPPLIDDALASVDYLMRRPGVSGECLLVGQSMGGLVAACTAHRDARIRAVALWNAPSNPLRVLQSALGAGSIGSAFVDGVVEFPWDRKGTFRLKRRFFESLIEISVLDEVARFPGRLLVIAGRHDELIQPQPAMAEAFLRVHRGDQRLVMMETDHTFNTTKGQTEPVDAAIRETIAWFEAGDSVPASG